ncbi:flagellar basal body-associated FliL family protein [Chitinimonas sp. PSY-7]|uniref:flagellar basal body-associated FliL family protein n=1 Tax=Chitinimonas sp. PSY-7 TaxID=3459088 RepID=UPI00403FDE28
MAEAKKPAPAAEPAASAPKSKKNLVLYIVIGLLVLVILVGGVFAAWLFMTISANQNFGEQSSSESHSDGDKKDEKDKKKKDKKDKKEHAGPPIFDKLDTYTVNLLGGTVLQTEIHIQVADEKQKEVVKSYLPRISSQVNLLLSSKKPEEIATLEGKVALMGELKQTINKVLDAKEDEDGVMSVEFKSFIVQ